MIKIWHPPKMAKMSLKWPKSTLCEFRAAWSGVFWVPGGTTGPGFKAEIRPPLFLMFFDTFLSFYTFSFSWFCWFLCFCESDKLIKCWKVAFFVMVAINVIRPYGNNAMSGRFTGVVFHRGEMMICVVVLPSFSFNVFLLIVFFGLLKCRGDSQESRDY